MLTRRLTLSQFQYSIHSILYQRGVYPAEDFTVVKKYGLNMLVSSDDQVKAYIKKIMTALDRWMKDGKISKLVIVITNKDTSEHLERWQFDVRPAPSPPPFLRASSAGLAVPNPEAPQTGQHHRPAKVQQVIKTKIRRQTRSRRRREPGELSTT